LAATKVKLSQGQVFSMEGKRNTWHCKFWSQRSEPLQVAPTHPGARVISCPNLYLAFNFGTICCSHVCTDRRVQNHPRVMGPVALGIQNQNILPKKPTRARRSILTLESITFGICIQNTPAWIHITYVDLFTIIWFITLFEIRAVVTGAKPGRGAVMHEFTRSIYHETYRSPG
jgi:hypothetical protein